MSNNRVSKPKIIHNDTRAKPVPKPTIRQNNFRILFSKYQVVKKTSPKTIDSKKSLAFDTIDQPPINKIDSKIAISKENHPPLEPNVENVAKAPPSIEGINIEKTALSSTYVDDINSLVKKLTLSFSAKKAESCFFIKDGIFKNARFYLRCQDKNLDLMVSNAEIEAIALVKQHRGYLATKLATKEINLQNLMFG